MTRWDGPPLPQLVDPAWVAERIGQPGVLIADCSYDADSEVAHAIYLSGHIPGAVHIYWPRDLAVGTGLIPNLLPPTGQAAATLGRLGIGDDTLVIAYDQEGGHFSARLWFVLAYIGQADHMYVLNGGTPRWRAEGRPLATDEVQPTPRTLHADEAHEELRITKDELLSKLGEPGVVIADVRRPTEHFGSEVRAARGGRIPGSINVLWRENLRDDWTFKLPEEIRARHEAAGITPEQEVITYCQAGVRAAHAAIALRMAGYRNVRIYDGSWADWGNDQDVPISEGPPNPHEL